MATIDIKLEGVEKAIASLKKYQIVKRQAVENVTKEIGFKIETQAKAWCPVDTGRLRASISTNWAGSGMNEGKIGAKAKPGDGVKEPKGDKGLIAVVGTNVEYGPYQEFGTSKMVESPYLYPAYFHYIEEYRRRIAAIMKQETE